MVMGNEEQARQWSADMGRNWVEQQAEIDDLLAEPLNLLLRHAGLRAGERVLDIGCGTGASTLRAAGAVGPSGEVLGVDISPLMIDRAKERADAARAAHVGFLTCDAETQAFPPGRFDRAISRFGVMFFSDPVAAFRNIGRAVRPGGTLTFVAWSRVEHNPWFSIPGRIAAARFGITPAAADPHAPGPMAFADTGRVTGILSKAGLAEVEAAVHDVLLTPPGGLRDVADLATRVGPAAGILRENNGTDDDRQAIGDDVAQAFAAFVQAGHVLVPAALTLYAAVSAGPVR